CADVAGVDDRYLAVVRLRHDARGASAYRRRRDAAGIVDGRGTAEGAVGFHAHGRTVGKSRGRDATGVGDACRTLVDVGDDAGGRAAIRRDRNGTRILGLGIVAAVGLHADRRVRAAGHRDGTGIAISGESTVVGIGFHARDERTDSLAVGGRHCDAAQVVEVGNSRAGLIEPTNGDPIDRTGTYRAFVGDLGCMVGGYVDGDGVAILCGGRDRASGRVGDHGFAEKRAGGD